jgi:hypothetical protein
MFTIDLISYFFPFFLDDERELLNAILFRQIHILQDLPGIVVFRGHVYGIEYMFISCTCYIMSIVSLTVHNNILYFSYILNIFFGQDILASNYSISYGGCV